MSNEIKYELTGGMVIAPEKGSIEIPPENTGRKDLEEGELLLISVEIPKMEEVALVRNANNYGIKEVPSIAITGATKVDTTIRPDDIGNKVDFVR